MCQNGGSEVRALVHKSNSALHFPKIRQRARNGCGSSQWRKPQNMHGNLPALQELFLSESSNDDDELKQATGRDEKKRKNLLD